MNEALVKSWRWTKTLHGAHQFADDLGSTGCWVGPRKGPMPRTQGEKEDYVLRRLLVAWRYEDLLPFPLEILAETTTPTEPDFILRLPDGTTLGVEVTEAGEESYQAWLTRTEKQRAEPGKAHEVDSQFEPSTANTITAWIEAVQRKSRKFDQGSYRGADACDLVVYDNTSWGGFSDKRELIAGLTARNDLHGRFRQVHIVCDEMVWLDVFESRSQVDISMAYETDYAAWVFDQAEKLRLEDRGGLDIDNLIEEVESLGKSERRAFASHLKNLMHHLLKWQCQPKMRSNSWRATIDLSRRELQESLSEMPSLRREIDDVADREYPKARQEAVRETGLPVSTFPELRPYHKEQLVDPEFYPEGVDDG